VVLHDAGVESLQILSERRVAIRQGVEGLIAHLLKEATLNGADRLLDAGLIAWLVRPNPFIAVFDKTAARNSMPAWVGSATDDLNDVSRIQAVLRGDALQFLFSRVAPSSPGCSRDARPCPPAHVEQGGRR